MPYLLPRCPHLLMPLEELLLIPSGAAILFLAIGPSGLECFTLQDAAFFLCLDIHSLLPFDYIHFLVVDACLPAVEEEGTLLFYLSPAFGLPSFPALASLYLQFLPASLLCSLPHTHIPPSPSTCSGRIRCLQFPHLPCDFLIYYFCGSPPPTALHHCNSDYACLEFLPCYRSVAFDFTTFVTCDDLLRSLFALRYGDGTFPTSESLTYFTLRCLPVDSPRPYLVVCHLPFSHYLPYLPAPAVGITTPFTLLLPTIR